MGGCGGACYETELDTNILELLCCTEARDGSNIGLRKLATMFVCDYCSYLFANGEALDRHRLACFAHEDYYPILMVITLYMICSSLCGLNVRINE